MNPLIKIVLPEDSFEPVEEVDSEKSMKNVHPIYSSEEVDSEIDGDLNNIKSEPKPVIINLSDSDKHIPSIPYVVYSEEQNPWDFIETGLNTDHI